MSLREYISLGLANEAELILEEIYRNEKPITSDNLKKAKISETDSLYYLLDVLETGKYVKITAREVLDGNWDVHLITEVSLTDAGKNYILKNKPELKKAQIIPTDMSLEEKVRAVLVA